MLVRAEIESKDHRQLAKQIQLVQILTQKHYRTFFPRK